MVVGGDRLWPWTRRNGDAPFFATGLRKHSQAGLLCGTYMHGWVPILIMIGLGAGFGAFNIIASHLIGPHKPTPEKLAPYECGMPPVGDARERHPVKFYLVAMIFLLFDIEVAFLYPFALALRVLGLDRLRPDSGLLCHPADRLRVRLAQRRARLGPRARIAFHYL